MTRRTGSTRSRAGATSSTPCRASAPTASARWSPSAAEDARRTPFVEEDRRLVHGTGLAECRIILQPRGPFVVSRVVLVLVFLFCLFFLFLAGGGLHLDLGDRDAVALHLARQRDLVAFVVLETGEVLVRDLVGLAARHEHVLGAARDALVGAVVIAVHLRPVLSLRVLAGALAVGQNSVPCLVSRHKSRSRREQDCRREQYELLHLRILLEGLITNKRASLFQAPR